MDGVCVRWRGYIDLERLDGTACLEYDEERGRLEDAILKEQIEQYKLRMRDFEEQQRLYKMAQSHAEQQQQQHKKTTQSTTNNSAASIAHDITKSEVSKIWQRRRADEVVRTRQ